MSNPSAHGELTHAAIASRYKLPIAGTMILLTGENLISAIAPLFLGRAIDGLVAETYAPLWVFLALAMTGLAIAIGRRVYDTRVYARIYRETAAETVEKENSKDAAVTRITARANFVSEFVEFFEFYLPMALTAFVGLIGSVVMLAFLSVPLAICAAAVGVMMGIVFFVSSPRIRKLNAMLNDEMERQVDILTARQKAGTQHHFASIARWRIRLSDLEARNFGLVFFLTIALTAGAAYILVVLEQKTVGEVFAALTYVLQFSDAVVMLPYTYQQFLRTREISTRLQES